jgi:NADH:ubiquinone oxidoreductase subunit 6 (subunit J)
LTVASLPLQLGPAALAPLLALFLGLALPVGPLIELPADLALPPGAVAGAVAARGAVRAVAQPLFQSYLVPFEITSLLLLAAIVGAVVLAKRRL